MLVAWTSSRFLAVAPTALARKITTVAGGSALAYGITLVLTPLITRAYGPDVYGAQGLFLSIANAAAVVGGLCYPLAIVLPQEDRVAHLLARVSLIATFLVGAVLTALIAGFGDLFPGAPLLARLWWLLPVFVAFHAVGSIGTQELIRDGRYAATAKIAVSQSIVANLGKLASGMVAPTAGALILAHLAGMGASVALNVVNLRKNAHHASSRELWGLAKRYRDFPLLRAPQTLINAASAALPVVMLSSLFGVSAAGYYALANTILAGPVALIGTSISQVFYPEANRKALQGEDVRRIARKATMGLCLISAPLFVVPIALGPDLFAFCFGAEWRESGEYARWLSPFLFLGFINKPAVAVLPILRLQGRLLAYEVLSTAARVAALLVGFYWLEDAVATIALFSIVGSVAYLLLIHQAIFRES